MPCMLIDVHAHFFPEHGSRADWREYNAARLRAGETIGISIHLTSILGTFGRTSPTYFPSPADVVYGNDSVLALQRQHPNRIRRYVTVNPTYSGHAVAEIQRRCRAATIGLKPAPNRPAARPLAHP